MRVAVTGASGFCGTAVARSAAGRGGEVTCFGRRPGPVGKHVYWDAASDGPDFGDAEVVMHLAAAVGDGKGAAFRRVNVEGAERLLAAVDGRPLVWVSSASVYRPGPYAGPVGEEFALGGQRSDYGRTKAVGDRLALAAGAVVLRPRAVYGHGDPHLLPRLRRVVRGGHAWLPGPDVPISLTGVDNLAEACLAAVSWRPGAYNLADAEVYSRDAAVRHVLGVPVRHFPVAVARALAVVSRQISRYGVDQLTDGMVLDTAKATAAGWQPSRTLYDWTP